MTQPGSVPLRVVDLADPPDLAATGAPDAVVVATGDPTDPAARHWLRHATFTLTETPCADRRVVVVPSVADALAALGERVGTSPMAALVCDDVLRAVDTDAPSFTGIVTESLAYSTLQSGPEFGRWLAARGPAAVPHNPAPVVSRRDGDVLHVRFNSPRRHNAFSTPARAELLAALSVAQLDGSVSGVVLGGNGPSFCSGGDLDEFGSFSDPAAAHLARTRHSPALVLDALSVRLGRGLRAQVHGQVLGSGLEMASFCGHVRAAPGTTFGLPELALGLIPGAGGTVSVTRRIGRWRTAYLVLSGRTLGPETALEWGLVDEIGSPDPNFESSFESGVDTAVPRCDDTSL
ncbi:enoyl-CoA hydratase/isomerase family protein [Mycolicibacterium palauense]|uniref:enoyl-CoA hydratase/isomerase family protein n=1 Tax=Mycolicibacterium palauense TaxID=2034511 RepID=UPI00389963F7